MLANIRQELCNMCNVVVNGKELRNRPKFSRGTSNQTNLTKKDVQLQVDRLIFMKVHGQKSEEFALK